MSDNMDNDQTAINTLEDQVIILSTTTAVRLASLGPDAMALYLFYTITAKRQSQVCGKYINQIKASTSYCMQGLGWGKDKFYRIKKMLADEQLIEQVTKQDKEGKITGHYLLIHYLVDNQSPRKPDSGFNHPLVFKDTNTNDKKINTNDKKINTDSEGNPPKNFLFSGYVTPGAPDHERVVTSYSISSDELRMEIEAMRAWLEDTGKQLKRPRTFITNWLNKKYELRSTPLDPQEKEFLQFHAWSVSNDDRAIKTYKAWSEEKRNEFKIWLQQKIGW